VTRTRERLASALVALVTTLVSFAGVEWYARRRETALARAPAATPALGLVRANPSGAGSYRLRPGLDLETSVRGHRVRIRTNSLGMHWREVAREKPEGVRRVAFLGDSFVFGCWTPSVESSLVGVFERGYPGGRVEALNFGVGGYGTSDEELLLNEEVLSFAPDWVIVGLFTGNDFRDTWLGLDKHEVGQDGTAELRTDVLAAKVPAAYRDAPMPETAAAPDPSRWRRGLSRFATFRLLFARFGWASPWIEFPVSRRFTSFPYWSLVPPPPVSLQAREAVVGSLTRMNTTSAAHGARFAVIAIPSREQVYAARESGPEYDVELPQAWLRVWARESGVPYLDLRAPFRAHAREHAQELYVPGDIHWNERGHALAGEWTRAWFRDEVRPLGFVSAVPAR
jgi:hypothetical protein